jgi:hypothetical protein
MLRAPRRLSASAAMLKTVQLRVEGPVALTGFFVRRDAFRRARRCLKRFNSVSRTPRRSRAPSCAATHFGERGDAPDGSTPCRGPRGAHMFLRAPRRLWASAAMLKMVQMPKAVQLRVEDPVALKGPFVRRDAFRRARRCSRRYNSVSRTPWRSRAPSCAATRFGGRGDAQDGSILCRGPRGAHGLFRASRHTFRRAQRCSNQFNSMSRTPWRSRAPSCAATPFGERGDAQVGSKAQGCSTPCREPRGAHGPLRAPRRLLASAAMLKTVQLRVEDPVALTGFFVRRDAFRRARRAPRGAHGLLRAPRRLSASAVMLRAPRRLSASAAMLKTVQLRVEGPVALTGFFVRRDAFR